MISFGFVSTRVKYILYEDIPAYLIIKKFIFLLDKNKPSEIYKKKQLCGFNSFIKNFKLMSDMINLEKSSVKMELKSFPFSLFSILSIIKVLGI